MLLAAAAALGGAWHCAPSRSKSSIRRARRCWLTANSLLLSVEFAGKRILLTGDLESPGIERVLADPPLDCDVLLAPHHGNASSDPPGFPAWCSPEWVVMSGERPERTESTNISYQRTGAAVLHTAERGAITFTVAGTGIASNCYRD